MDGTGTIAELREEGDSLWVTIKTSPDLLRYIVPKVRNCNCPCTKMYGTAICIVLDDFQDFERQANPHIGDLRSCDVEKEHPARNLQS